MMISDALIQSTLVIADTLGTVICHFVSAVIAIVCNSGGDENNPISSFVFAMFFLPALENSESCHI